MKNVEPYDPMRRIRSYVDRLIMQDLTNEQKKKEKARPQREHQEKKGIHDLVRDLENQYEAFPHYTDDHYLQSRAKTHTSDVLSQREEIIAEYIEFKSHAALVDWLKENAPPLYNFKLWRIKLLEYAERYAVEAQGGKPRLTPEEHHARIKRFRARMLTRSRVQAEDHMAQALQKLTLRNQFLEELAQYDLDEDEHERLLREFEDTMETPEEDTNGQYKKL